MLHAAQAVPRAAHSEVYSSACAGLHPRPALAHAASTRVPATLGPLLAESMLTGPLIQRANIIQPDKVHVPIQLHHTSHLVRADLTESFEGPFQLFVRFTKIFTINGVYASDDVQELVEKVYSKIGVPRGMLRLVLGGKQLEVGSTLAACGLAKGMTITLSMRVRGGGCGTSKSAQIRPHSPIPEAPIAPTGQAVPLSLPKRNTSVTSIEEAQISASASSLKHDGVSSSDQPPDSSEQCANPTILEATTAVVPSASPSVEQSAATASSSRSSSLEKHIRVPKSTSSIPLETSDSTALSVMQSVHSITDPRWDSKGFEAWIAASAPFVKVRFLRQLASRNSPIPCGPEARHSSEYHWTLPQGCGVTGTQLFAVLSSSLLAACTNPTAELNGILAVLDAYGEAAEDDLIFWHHICSSPGDTANRDGMFRMFTHYRVQTIVVMHPIVEHSVFERLETMAFLALSCFCQRIVNASEDALKNELNMEKLVDLPNTLAGLQCDGFAAFQRISTMLEYVIRALKPVAQDEEGFVVLCEEANLAWLRVPYLKKLAMRGGPCPRRQELDPDGTIVGRKPKGRMVAVSHAWDASFHICPSGDKLRALVEELDRLGFDDPEDGVFIDYASLSQRAPKEMPRLYFETNGLHEELKDRTPAESKQFRFALWEMSRLYCYREMNVIVLPQTAVPTAFPGGQDAWGTFNPNEYGYRGWCMSEYAISRFSHRIANKSNEHVQKIDGLRHWPVTVAEYVDAMRKDVRPKPIEFTNGGDRDVVVFLFYRVCFGMLHSFIPEEWHNSQLWRLPMEERRLAEAELLDIGDGDVHREYFMHIAVQPPPSIAGDPTYSSAMQNMQTSLLAHKETWELRKKFPIIFSDASAPRVRSTLAEGRTHCLVWAAPGIGWEAESSDKTNYLSAHGLCETLTQLPTENRPGVIFLCMPFGPERVASRIVNAGAPVVVWIRLNVLEEGVAVLLGLISPMLELLSAPRATGMSAANLNAEIFGLGRQLYGSSWKAAGVKLVMSNLKCLPAWRPKPRAADTPWVHRIADGALRRSSSGATELYEALKLVIVHRSEGQVDLLDQASPMEICAWLQETLPSSSGHRPVIIALYADEDSDHRPVLQARILISSVGFLHELRDVALTGELDRTLSAAELIASRGLAVSIDRAQFCRMYEGSVLSLDKLTEHQTSKLNECLAAQARFVHLKAPAGAGKTFVAMHMLLERMRQQPDALVLFVARNVALCYFVVRWLARRVPNALQRLKLLKRLFILFEPFHGGLHSVTIRHGRIETTPSERSDTEFALVVVDESHHVYSDPKRKSFVESHVSTRTGRLLISDVSQSLGWDIDFPNEDVVEVVLTEVVRSTQRIVAGASAFQLGDQKELTSSQHNATGPPLKTFVFDASSDTQGWTSAYVEHTIKAIQHVSRSLGDLDLHDRIAIIVPDDETLTALRNPLQAALKVAYAQRPYRLLDAREAATVVADTDGDTDSEGWLILDSIENFDGLERIVVICVGLDTVIEQSDALQTRSLIYRAMTRAHMMVVVVNHFLQGGWLAFLRTLQLEAEAKAAEYSDKQRSSIFKTEDAQAVERTTTEAKFSSILREFEVENKSPTGVITLLTKATQLHMADAGIPIVDENIREACRLAWEQWHALVETCTSAVASALESRSGEVPDAGTQSAYVHETARNVVRAAAGRLPKFDSSLSENVSSAAFSAMSSAIGWRTPAFIDECREAALAIGWSTSDRDWLRIGDGGKDLGQGVNYAMTEEKMTVEQAVRKMRDVHEAIVGHLRAEGITDGPDFDELFRRAFSAGKIEKGSEYRRVRAALEAFEAEKEAALGIKRQFVWDVESTAQEPLGELKFTPYPVEKKFVDWLDQDGDQVGFELDGNRMYRTEHGKRRAPYGPAHVIMYRYPGRRGPGYFDYSDSRMNGGSIPCVIPLSNVDEVQEMWNIAKSHLP